MFYRPTLDDQRRDSELRRLRLVRIHQKSYPASSGKTAPQPPQEPGIYNTLNFPWLVHNYWDEFKVKYIRPDPFTVIAIGGRTPGGMDARARFVGLQVHE